MLTDEQISGMTQAQRRALIMRLGSPLEEVRPAPETLRRFHHLRLGLTIGGSVVLVPWTLYLARTLPGRVLVDNWQAVWVGYDLLLLVMLIITAWLGWRRRQAMVLTAFGTGVLVLADAWFDILTSSRYDTWISVTAALVVEIPVALLLMSASVTLLRLATVRFLVLPADTSFWKLPLILDGDALSALDPPPPPALL